MPLDKDKSCPLLLDKSSWDGTFGKCIMMIVKMLPSTLDMLFMISLCFSVAAHYCLVWLLISGVRNTWMYGGELDCVYGLSIDHFLN